MHGDTLSEYNNTYKLKMLNILNILIKDAIKKFTLLINVPVLTVHNNLGLFSLKRKSILNVCIC